MIRSGSPLALAALALTLAACDGSSPLVADVAPAFSKGGPPKVALCHLDADAGTYRLISVAAPALDAHLRHGDGRPGGPVPAMEGFTFDEACQPVGGDVAAPTCTVTPFFGTPPQRVEVAIENEESGLAEILITRSENADTVVPPFIVGTTEPVNVTSTQIDPANPSGIEIRVTDLAGNTSPCVVSIPVLTLP